MRARRAGVPRGRNFRRARDQPRRGEDSGFAVSGKAVSGKAVSGKAVTIMYLRDPATVITG